MIEAKKIAWADRAKFYADPAFAQDSARRVFSKSYAAERRKLIDPNRAANMSKEDSPPGCQGRQASTCHLSGSARRLLALTGEDACLPHGDTIYMCAADEKATWSVSFQAITAAWAAASSCWTCFMFRIAANFSRWTRITRTFTRRANDRFTPSFPVS